LSTPISEISEQVNSRCSWFGLAIDVRGIGCICRPPTITTTENYNINEARQMLQTLAVTVMVFNATFNNISDMPKIEVYKKAI
jgi:hypothetical protein